MNDSFERGARLFDAGEFFAAHEAWEDRWRVATDMAERTFLQGLVQVAAAFHKLLVMKNPEAALRLLAKGVAKLDAYSSPPSTMDLAAFREGLRHCARDIERGRFIVTTIPFVLRQRGS